jgi:uncharacterized membrane protein
MLAALSNLVPNPLHPAVVHLPIALTLLVPAFAAVALVAIQRGARPLRAWGVTTALLALLSLSAWVSLETGEGQEERVEQVVPERAIDAHAAAAESFLALSLLVLAVAGVGLLNGKVGTAGRVTAAAGTIALLVAGYRVGHSGGALVYEHGAASVYVTGAAASGGSPEGAGGRRAADRLDDDR